MSDVDFWLQQCEGCEKWLSPDDDEISMPDTGPWRGSWICPKCADEPAEVGQVLTEPQEGQQ